MFVFSKVELIMTCWSRIFLIPLLSPLLKLLDASILWVHKVPVYVAISLRELLACYYYGFFASLIYMLIALVYSLAYFPITGLLKPVNRIVTTNDQ